MKTLLLLRHAKSNWDEQVDDYERGLNARGGLAAARMGREMQRLDLRLDLVLASPAKRVVDTINAMGLGADIKPTFDRRLYGASADQLLTIVRSIDNRVARLLLVGHNPGLSQLAELLIRDGKAGLQARLPANYPTAALAQIEFPVDHWREVGPNEGILTSFVRPRDLE